MVPQMNDMKFTTAGEYMETNPLALFNKQKDEAQTRIEELLQQELQDEDGYPTEAALEIISIWHWSEPKGWFDTIKSLWWMPDWGWKEQLAMDEITGKEEYCYYISTGGWSGNESIIAAMQKNEMMWHFNWVQSRRGGHYIFQLRELKDD
jgi:hypothetical protein